MEKQNTNPNVEKILAEIAALRAELKQTQTPSHEKPRESGHATLDEALACPNCGAKFKAEIEKLQKKHLDEHWRDNLDYECESCHTGVQVDEEKCPSCGKTKAKARRKAT